MPPRPLINLSSFTQGPKKLIELGQGAFNLAGKGLSAAVGLADNLVSSHLTYKAQAAPMASSSLPMVRGVALNEDDFPVLRGTLFAEISNRAPDKQLLEARTILNTALNRAAQQKKTLSQILTAPKQYQGYNSKEYKRLLSGKIGDLDKPKLQAIDEILKELRSGKFDDNIEGRTFYTHLPGGSIRATQKYQY